MRVWFKGLVPVIPQQAGGHSRLPCAFQILEGITDIDGLSRIDTQCLDNPDQAVRIRLGAAAFAGQDQVHVRARRLVCIRHRLAIVAGDNGDGHHRLSQILQQLFHAINPCGSGGAFHFVAVDNRMSMGDPLRIIQGFGMREQPDTVRTIQRPLDNAEIQPCIH